MDNDKVIAAIELGSSKISGAVARKYSDGRLKILACASLPSSAFIRHGAVYNLDKTAEAIANIVDLLEKQLNTKLLQVYVEYAGKSLRTVPVVLERNLEEGAVVTADMVDEMFAECGDMPLENMLSLCVASQEFRADHKNTPESDPVGVACTHIEGTFQKVVIRPRLFKLMDDSFRNASLGLADSFVAPMTLADLILTESERQRGCALVDYGADTTTVAIYKGGQLAWLRVIPLGSDTITRDIMSQFNVVHEQAESLKITYGLFGLSGSEEEQVTVGGKEFSLKLLGEIVEARNEEIMANVLHQINASGLYDSLFGGLILTGGGSSLKKLDVAVSRQFTGISPIRICSTAPIEADWCDAAWNQADGTHLSLLSMLVRGEDDCCDEVIVQDMTIEPTPQEQAVMVTGSLFLEDGESAQEKRDREEAQRRKEEAEARKKKLEEKKTERRSKGGKIYDSILASFHKFFDDVQ